MADSHTHIAYESRSFNHILFCRIAFFDTAMSSETPTNSGLFAWGNGGTSTCLTSTIPTVHCGGNSVTQWCTRCIDTNVYQAQISVRGDVTCFILGTEKNSPSQSAECIMLLGQLLHFYALCTRAF